MNPRNLPTFRDVAAAIKLLGDRKYAHRSLASVNRMSAKAAFQRSQVKPTEGKLK